MADVQHDTTLILAVDLITFVFGVPTNMLALVAFIKKLRENPTPMHVLLLNLTISDLLFLIFLPFRMKEAIDNLKWDMPEFLCPLSGYVFYVTIYNSILFLTAISLERYLGVAFPIKYKLRRKPRYAALFALLAWTVSLAHCSIVYIMHHFDEDNATASDSSEVDTCYKVFSEAQLSILLPVRLELFIVLFLLPLLICSFCYVHFIRLLSRMPNISLRKRNRAIGLAVGTLLVFLICFAPYNISHVVGFVNRRSPSWRKFAVLTSTLNACLDPFIYYFSSSALRGTFKHIMKRTADCLCCNWLVCGSRLNHLEDHTRAFTISSR